MVEPYEKVRGSKKDIIINNFIGGISWAFGATIGLTIIVAILGFMTGKLDLVPIVGTFVADVTKFVLQNNPQLVK